MSGNKHNKKMLDDDFEKKRYHCIKKESCKTGKGCLWDKIKYTVTKKCKD